MTTATRTSSYERNLVTNGNAHGSGRVVLTIIQTGGFQQTELEIGESRWTVTMYVDDVQIDDASYFTDDIDDARAVMYGMLFVTEHIDKHNKQNEHRYSEYDLVERAEITHAVNRKYYVVTVSIAGRFVESIKFENAIGAFTFAIWANDKQRNNQHAIKRLSRPVLNV